MRDATIIIRDRYQLTLPGQIRKYLDWVEPKRAVKIILLGKEKLLVEPYTEQKTDWLEVWKKLQALAKQRKKNSLSEFVVKDREKH